MKEKSEVKFLEDKQTIVDSVNYSDEVENVNLIHLEGVL